MLKIVNVPDPVLSQPVRPVTVFGPELNRLIQEMKRTLIAQTDPEGVGLAAPQVGKNLALFIIKPGPDSSAEAFVNPEILQSETRSRSPVSRSRKSKAKLEGCLSIPRIWGPVRRADKVLLEYQTAEGVKQTRWFTGFKAVIIQHEVDHLRGVLFTQRSLEQKKPLYEEKDGKLVKLDSDL
ncbi:peptide deformylase [Patescibacteria group bacterium]|nr:peptide deformylase [Patescibacteria group bacterium]MCL5091974.1 peptide deformylase [Patescibacteria group bacterium]